VNQMVGDFLQHGYSTKSVADLSPHGGINMELWLFRNRISGGGNPQLYQYQLWISRYQFQDFKR
jgi:hypothetical protein